LKKGKKRKNGVKDIKKPADNPTEEKKEKKPKKIINESEYATVHLGKLLNSPQLYLDKKIKFRGEFSSFSTLALDYEPAKRDSKDYISLCIFRPNTKIPLSELKLAYPVEDAKDDEIVAELSKGDLVEIFGQEFSTALDEPWLDVHSVKLIKAVKPKEEDLEEKDKDVETEKKKDKKEKK
jgi:hypothetical protein